MNRPIVADYRLLAAAGILSVFGIAMVYSAGQTDTPTAVATAYKSQMLWLLIGLGFAYAGRQRAPRAGSPSEVIALVSRPRLPR